MNSSGAGTGWSSAAGVVTTTSVSGVRPTPRSARRRESTPSRSLDAANASRMSPASCGASGKTAVVTGRSPPKPAANNAVSSASCSAARGLSATTSHTGAGSAPTSPAITAPRAGGQMPVSLRRAEMGASGMGDGGT